MKRVSFKVAKAIKEAGYPQDYKNAEDTYTNLNGGIWVKPTYLEVWLWLWREKKLCINCNYDKYNLLPMWWCNNEDGINYNTPNFTDPEEAIIAAIDTALDKYLKENKTN